MMLRMVVVTASTQSGVSHTHEIGANKVIVVPVYMLIFATTVVVRIVRMSEIFTET